MQSTIYSTQKSQSNMVKATVLHMSKALNCVVQTQLLLHMSQLCD